MTDRQEFPGSYYMRSQPPEGFGITFQKEGEDLTVATFTLDEHKEGPPGFAHGGAVAAILDEAMGAAVYLYARLSYTATMTVNYRQSVPLGVEVRAIAKIERVDGKKTHVSAKIVLPDDSIAANSTGIFIYSPRLKALFDAQKSDIDR